MKVIISGLIENFIKERGDLWDIPIVEYIEADNKGFAELKKIVTPLHAMPQNFLEDAESVVAYFIPFNKEVVLSNINGESSSKMWAEAYIEINQLILELNTYIKENLAGLGSFGLNNMLITDKGCCGRVGTIVTNIKISCRKIENRERCLYKAKGICKKCVERCVNNALKVDGFDRHKCYEMCLYNAEVHKEIGLADVCGKCLVNVPCSFVSPIKYQKHKIY